MRTADFLLHKMIFFAPDYGGTGGRGVPQPPEWLTEGLRTAPNRRPSPSPEDYGNDSLDLEPSGYQDLGPDPFGNVDSGGPGAFSFDQNPQSDGNGNDSMDLSDEENHGYGDYVGESPSPDREEFAHYQQDQPGSQNLPQQQPAYDEFNRPAPEFANPQVEDFGSGPPLSNFDDEEKQDYNASPAPDYPQPSGYGAEAPAGFPDLSQGYGTPPGHEFYDEDGVERIEFGRPPQQSQEQPQEYPQGFDQGYEQYPEGYDPNQPQYQDPQYQDPQYQDPQYEEGGYDEQGYPVAEDYNDQYAQQQQQPPNVGGVSYRNDNPYGQFSDGSDSMGEPATDFNNPTDYQQFPDRESDDHFTGANSLRAPQPPADRFTTDKSDENVNVGHLAPAPPPINDLPKVSLGNLADEQKPKAPEGGGSEEILMSPVATSDPGFEQLSIGSLKRGEDGRLDTSVLKKDEVEPIQPSSPEIALESWSGKAAAMGGIVPPADGEEASVSAKKREPADFTPPKPPKPQMSPEARAAMVTGIRIYGVGMILMAGLILALGFLLADASLAFIVATPAFVMGCVLMAGNQLIGFLGMVLSLAYAGGFAFVGYDLMQEGAIVKPLLSADQLPDLLPQFSFGIAGGLLLGSLLMVPVKLGFIRSMIATLIAVLPALVMVPLTGLAMTSGPSSKLGTPMSGYGVLELEIPGGKMSKPAGWGQFSWDRVSERLPYANYFAAAPDLVFVNRIDSMVVTVSVEEFPETTARLAQFLRTKPTSQKVSNLTRGLEPSGAATAVTVAGTTYEQLVYEAKVGERENIATTTVLWRASLDDRFVFLTATKDDASFVTLEMLDHTLKEFAETITF